HEIALPLARLDPRRTRAEGLGQPRLPEIGRLRDVRIRRNDQGPGAGFRDHRFPFVARAGDVLRARRPAPARRAAGPVHPRRRIRALVGTREGPPLTSASSAPTTWQWAVPRS